MNAQSAAVKARSAHGRRSPASTTRLARRLAACDGRVAAGDGRDVQGGALHGRRSDTCFEALGV